jgi:hypothetical protein
MMRMMVEMNYFLVDENNVYHDQWILLVDDLFELKKYYQYEKNYFYDN